MVAVWSIEGVGVHQVEWNIAASPVLKNFIFPRSEKWIVKQARVTYQNVYKNISIDFFFCFSIPIQLLSFGCHSAAIVWMIDTQGCQPMHRSVELRMTGAWSYTTQVVKTTT